MPPLILVAALLEGLSLTLLQGYLPLYVRRTLSHTTYLTVGAVIAIPALGTFLASNFWGGLSDVSGRLKPFILVGLVGYCVAPGRAHVPRLALPARPAARARNPTDARLARRCHAGPCHPLREPEAPGAVSYTHLR